MTMLYRHSCRRGHLLNGYVVLRMSIETNGAERRVARVARTTLESDPVSTRGPLFRAACPHLSDTRPRHTRHESEIRRLRPPITFRTARSHSLGLLPFCTFIPSLQVGD